MKSKSPLQRLKDFDKSRTAVGKKPIFKDKNTKKGHKPVKEEWSFKDFVDQIQEDKQTKKPQQLGR